MNHRIFLFAILSAVSISAWPILAHGQYGGTTTTTSQSSTAQSTTATKSTVATLNAQLVDPAKKAAKQAATVEVTVTGVQLVDPALSGEKPVTGQGHLHYQVDGGVVVATTTTKLSFHGLAKGTHTIVVSLAANDHSPLGPQATLTVTVP
jgi:FtsP/CotA-like multicopper oxidase with cupredoxin domain